MVSASRKDSQVKNEAGMKDSLKNSFPLDGEKDIVCASKDVKELSSLIFLVLDRKSVSITRNEAFVEKYVCTIRKIASFEKKIENGFHSQENIFLLKLIPPNLIHGFQQQKKVSEQKHTFPTRKISFH